MWTPAAAGEAGLVAGLVALGFEGPGRSCAMLAVPRGPWEVLQEC